MSIRELTAELSRLLESLKQLGACLEQETAELSHINIEAMARLNQQKEQIATQLESGAPQVARQLKEAAVGLGLPEDSTLGAVAKALKARGNLEILQLHEQLNSVGENNRRLLALNREIAENFSASVGNTLEILTRLINQSSFYGARGGYEKNRTGSVLINREA